MTEKQDTPRRGGRATGVMSFQKIQQAMIFILILVLCGVATFYIDTFFTTENLVNNLLRNAAAWESSPAA